MSRARYLAIALLLATNTAPFNAIAQQYPNKPVRLLVPNPPGGAVDTVARLFAPKLADRLGQPVVAENRVGSNGNIAMEALARSTPDGYTLLIAADAQIVINPHLYSKLTIDTLKDLAPIATLAQTQMMLVVHPSMAAKNFRELVEYARRANPPIAYGSIGNGSQHHLVMEMLKAQAGIDLLHVPYKGGGPAMAALLAGEVALMFGGNSTAPHIKAGKVRALAVASNGRSPAFPDVPAINEIYPGVEARTWIALFAPANTPVAIVGRLRAELERIHADSDLQARFQSVGGMDPLATTAEEMSAMIRIDYDKYGKVVRSIGVKID